MNNKLTNYAQWTQVFDEIENWGIGYSDIKIMQSVQNGEIKWVSGTAERFTNRLINLINSRFSRLNKFYNDRCSNTFDSFEFQKILISFRKELIFLKSLANLKVLSDDIKQKLTENILKFARDAQKKLEEGAKKNLSEELKMIVYSNRIDNI